MYNFIEAHKEVMQEIRRLERTITSGPEDAYAREIQIKALHAKGNAIRTSAKEEQDRISKLPKVEPTKIQKLKNDVGEFIHLFTNPFKADHQLQNEREGD